MADDDAGSDAVETGGGAASRLRRWLEQRRNLALSLGCVGLVFVIALNVAFIVGHDPHRISAGPVAAAPVKTNAPTPSSAPSSPAPSEDVAAVASDDADFYDESDDGEPGKASQKPKAEARRFATVEQAALHSCTTASVDGLSRQIIAEARCLKPNAYVPLPSRPNLTVASQVFPYLELTARDRLLKALAAKPEQKMTINSALRTVAQQYLVWRWSANKRCGVPLATPPGQSNHEIGIALDISEPGRWRSALEAQQFKWLGKSDRVHFDYRGGSVDNDHTDVQAFQRLWNRNHPSDTIDTSGRYGPATEQRLRQSPADGFRLGPSCNKAANRSH